VELTPRTVDEVERPRRARRRPWLPTAVLGVLVLVVGFLVYKGLSDATVYFRNADEAVAQRAQLGDKRFRLQGTVIDDAVETADGVNFDVTFNGVKVAVHHVGDPPQLFQPGIPVVLEGHWARRGGGSPGDNAASGGGWFFASDRMLIKHSADYESKTDYQKRVREAEQGGQGGQAGSGNAAG
jgi:cytochrome c-type biogenesis protein CcmE